MQQAVKRSLREESLLGAVVMGGDVAIYIVLQLAPDGFARVIVVADEMSLALAGSAARCSVCSRSRCNA